MPILGLATYGGVDLQFTAADIAAISPVKYANDIYNIAEAFEMSTRNLARATNILENKQNKKIETIKLQRTPTTNELERAARSEPNDFRKQVDLARKLV